MRTPCEPVPIKVSSRNLVSTGNDGFDAETGYPHTYLAVMGTAPLGGDAMTTVEIEYCVPCGLLDPAVETQRELLESFGRDLDGVRLTTGHGGVFKVSVNDELVFDKAERGNRIDLDEIVETVGDRVAAGP
jgi:selenoprotein W-related protein